MGVGREVRGAVEDRGFDGGAGPVALRGGEGAEGEVRVRVRVRVQARREGRVRGRGGASRDRGGAEGGLGAEREGQRGGLSARVETLGTVGFGFGVLGGGVLEGGRG